MVKQSHVLSIKMSYDDVSLKQITILQRRTREFATTKVYSENKTINNIYFIFLTVSNILKVKYFRCLRKRFKSYMSPSLKQQHTITKKPYKGH